VNLPDSAKRLADAKTFAVLSTTNADGSPQSSVVWVKRDGDEILFSSILGRRKTRNMERDPRVSILMFDPADGYSYVEIRGTVSMTGEGGVELIDELSHKYDGTPFVEGHPDNVRIVFRVSPTHVVDR
jgi:PPOX class probable F420-dependent enzyme